MPTARPGTLQKLLAGVAIAAALVSVVGVGVAASSYFFTQQINPSTNSPKAEPVVTSTCVSAATNPLTLVTSGGSSNSSSNSSWDIYGCSASRPALQLNHVGGARASFIPSVSTKDLWIVPVYAVTNAVISAGCGDIGTLGFNLTADASITVNQDNIGTPMYYCMDTTTGSTIGGFTVTWSNGP